MEYPQELVILYQQMSEHTAPICAHKCRAPHSCCDAMYCQNAIESARDYGITLEPTGHPRFPLMGPNGCTAPPHFRPACTLHTCAMNSLGFQPGDAEWTARYFEIREKIEALDCESWI